MEMFLYTMHVRVIRYLVETTFLLRGGLCQFYQFITVQVLQQTAREGSLCESWARLQHSCG
jgi:hypothetical protein